MNRRPLSYQYRAKARPDGLFGVGLIYAATLVGLVVILRLLTA